MCFAEARPHARRTPWPTLAWRVLTASGSGGGCLRRRRYVVLPKDFEKGYKANTQKNDKDFEFYK